MNKELYDEVKVAVENISNEPELRDYLQGKLYSCTSEEEIKSIMAVGYEASKEKYSDAITDYFKNMYSSYYMKQDAFDEKNIKRMIDNPFELDIMLEILSKDAFTEDHLKEIYSEFEKLKNSQETVSYKQILTMKNIAKKYQEYTGIDLTVKNESIDRVEAEPATSISTNNEDTTEQVMDTPSNETQVQDVTASQDIVTTPEENTLTEAEQHPKTNAEYNFEIENHKQQAKDLEAEQKLNNEKRITEAAAAMGVGVSSFERKMKRNGVDLNSIDNIDIAPELLKDKAANTAVMTAPKGDFSKIYDKIKKMNTLRNTNIIIDNDTMTAMLTKKVTLREKAAVKIASCKKSVVNHMIRRTAEILAIGDMAKEKISELTQKVETSVIESIINTSNSINDVIKKSQETLDNINKQIEQRADKIIYDARLGMADKLYNAADKINPVQLNDDNIAEQINSEEITSDNGEVQNFTYIKDSNGNIIGKAKIAPTEINNHRTL